MRKKVKGGKQVKEGGNLLAPAARVGASVTEAPTPLFLIPPSEPSPPVLADLSQEVAEAQQIIIQH